MRMRFKQRLSALAAACGFKPEAPPPVRQRSTNNPVYHGGKHSKIRGELSRSTAKQQNRERLAHMHHLWPPQERSRRPEWSSAVPGEWSTERGMEDKT